jgi:hypothetical protein
MSLLLFVFRARDHRGLDGDLQAEDDRRGTHSGRSAAEDAGVKTFLPREEWALAEGKKVLSDGVAAQTIEAQPVFGQIEPSKRPRASRAEPQVREKMAILGLTWQEVETVRRRKRNEGRQKALSSVQSQLQTSGSSAVSVSTRTQSTPCHRSVPRKIATTFRSSSLACVPRAAVSDKLDGQMAQDHCLCAAAVRTG